jgi:hypothetical protein
MTTNAPTASEVTVVAALPRKLCAVAGSMRKLRDFLAFFNVSNNRRRSYYTIITIHENAANQQGEEAPLQSTTATLLSLSVSVHRWRDGIPLRNQAF